VVRYVLSLSIVGSGCSPTSPTPTPQTPISLSGTTGPGGQNFAGSYTLTIEAHATCAAEPTPLPAPLRRRTFPAEIRQTGARLAVSVGGSCAGADFDGGCEFAGTASSDGAVFQLTEGEDLGYYQMPDLVERLGGDDFSLSGTTNVDRSGLWFLGRATTNVSDTGLSGNLDGTMTYYRVVYPFPFAEGRISGCRTGRFDLVRR
jgi:hypothetical protein